MFFRLILLFFLVYLVVKTVGRLWIGLTGSDKMSGNSDTFNQGKRKEGDVFIRNAPEHRRKKIASDEGEYIKYEEIDDEP